MIRIRSINRPKGVKLRFEYDHIAPSGVGYADQSGYRQLCSLWFEYDLCLNRKPPNDHFDIEFVLPVYMTCVIRVITQSLEANASI